MHFGASFLFLCLPPIYQKTYLFQASEYNLNPNHVSHLLLQYRSNISEASLRPVQMVCVSACFPLPTVEDFLLVLLSSWHLTDLLKTLHEFPNVLHGISQSHFSPYSLPYESFLNPVSTELLFHEPKVFFPKVSMWPCLVPSYFYSCSDFRGLL